jgi:hypothetical protein
MYENLNILREQWQLRMTRGGRLRSRNSDITGGNYWRSYSRNVDPKINAQAMCVMLYIVVSNNLFNRGLS